MAFAVVHTATRVHGGFTTIPDLPVPTGWELRAVTRQAELAAAAKIEARAGESFWRWRADFSDTDEATRQEAGDAGADRTEVQRRIDAVWDACVAARDAFVADRRVANAQAFIDRFGDLEQVRNRIAGLGARG